MTNRDYLNSSNPYICIDKFFLHIPDSLQSVTIVICILIFVIIIISNYHSSLTHDKKYLLKKQQTNLLYS